MTTATTTRSRRGAQIEAKNPALIKEVFAAGAVLDLGCGPGALMHLLWELGVDVEGIDFAESSKRLATPEVRDRITIGYVGDATLKPADAYDLVICREVLEHLTVLQVQAGGRQHGADDVAVHLRAPRGSIPSPADLLDFNHAVTTSTRRTSPCSTRTCCG